MSPPLDEAPNSSGDMRPENPVPLQDDIKTEKDDIGLTFTFVDIVSATQNVIFAENLLYFNVKSWVLYLRNDFDCVVNGEPYQALSFLFHLESGQFFIRVWNKTIKKGVLNSLTSVHEKISEAFQGQKPCLGLDHVGKTALRSKAIATDLPYTRYISTKCEYVTKCSPSSNENLCLSCAALKPKPKVKAEEQPTKPPKEEADSNNRDEDFELAAELIPDPDYKEEEDGEEEEESDPEYDDEDEYDDDDFDIDIEAFKEQCMTEGRWKAEKKPKEKGKRGRKRKQRDWEIFECKQCSDTFESADTFTEHVIVDHSECSEMECKLQRRLATF